MRDAYIVTSIRTPGCRSHEGGFRDTRPEDLLSFILQEAVARTENMRLSDVDDILVGCSVPEAEQGLNIGHLAARIAGFPNSVAGSTVNRMCASSLEAIAMATTRIMAGWADVVIAAGVESSSYVPLAGNKFRPHPDYANQQPGDYAAMGIYADKFAARYGISRQEQDEFAYLSHAKATQSRQQNQFSELVPTPAIHFAAELNGCYVKETILQNHDDSINDDICLEALAKLLPAYSIGGTVTSGNIGSISDGAAATVVMSANKIKEFCLTPVAKLNHYVTVGCPREEKAAAPLLAIQMLLKSAGVAFEDVGLFEINEDFAASVLYSMRELGLNHEMDRVNVHGGAIALGHAPGAIGAKLCATLLAGMRQRGVKYGVESVATGGGTGAAALFSLCT